MRNIESTIEINAPSAAVWSRLSCLNNYATWNSKTRFAANGAMDKTILMRVKLFGLWLPVPVRIQTFSPTAGLRWKGGIPGIFTGSHYFRLEPLRKGRTLLRQGEDFSGLCVRPLWTVLRNELAALHQSINSDLQAAVASKAARKVARP